MTILTITGPTCAGKSTLEKELQARGLGRAISHTTRPMRVGEVNGVAYHFVTPKDLTDMAGEGQLVESVAFGGHFYAMSAAALSAAQALNDHVVIVVEPHGAAQIWEFCKKNAMSVRSVWVDCSPQAQAKRFIRRLEDDAEQIGHKAFDTYAGRLGMMLGEEATWREKAMLNRQLYDLMLDSGRATPRMMASTVLEFLQ